MASLDVERDRPVLRVWRNRPERRNALEEIEALLTKTQFRAYANRAGLGDVTESDGDLLMAASRQGAARDNFRVR